MELTGQRTIPAPIGVTWQALNDPGHPLFLLLLLLLDLLRLRFRRARR